MGIRDEIKSVVIRTGSVVEQRQRIVKTKDGTRDEPPLGTQNAKTARPRVGPNPASNYFSKVRSCKL